MSGNEALKPAMNKLATMHLTMFVVHLTDDEEMSRLVETCSDPEGVGGPDPLTLNHKATCIGFLSNSGSPDGLKKSQSYQTSIQC